MLSQSFCRRIAWAISLIISLALLASASGSRQLVAPVESTNGVAIGGAPAQTHDALFAGDVLSTPEGASALVKFSSLTQATVLQDSSVQFRLDPSGQPVAKILSGTLSARAAGEKAVVVQTSKYRIEPAKGQAAVYLVGVLPDLRTIIEAHRGNVSITEERSGETYLLPAGKYILFDASAAGLPGQEEEKNKQAPGKPAGQVAPTPPPPSKPKPAAKPAKQPWHIGSLSHGASIAVVLGIAAGGAAGAVAAAAGGGGPSASPSSP